MAEAKQSTTIVRFGGGNHDAQTGDISKNHLGGKGANLVEMAKLDFPVPPGFVIPCTMSVKYKQHKNDQALLDALLDPLWDQVDSGMKFLHGVFGCVPLVSVRSGARVSMPGMMDTILNVGLCEDTLPFWTERMGERAALDSYRRLMQMYGSVVFEIPMALFDTALDAVKHRAEVENDADLTVAHLKEVIAAYEAVLQSAGHTLPDTPRAQVQGAIQAVFRSWDNQRAIEYRKINSIPDDWGTAVTVQSMVFGNLNDQSATGVVFTRCPSTGNGKITGEFLINAQGEDVVAGIRTPEPIAKMTEWNPELAEELGALLTELEQHYRDMQDVEFTVQDNKLFILQTRSGKRSAKAAFKIAVDLANEGTITKEEAVKRVTQKQLLALMQDTIDPDFQTPPHLTGIAAGGGLVTGVAVFSAADAMACKEPCILIRKETDPDDIGGMNAAVGILTATGGLTSHAAVVARGMNKTCVVGATDLWVDDGASACTKKGNGESIFKGTKVTLDGATGHVWVGITVPVVKGGQSPEVKTILSWTAGSVPERITLYPEQTDAEWADTLTQTGASIHIDTALLEGGCRFDTTFVASQLGRLGEALTACPAEEISLDFSSLHAYWTSDDRLMEVMFSGSQIEELVLNAKVASVTVWPMDLRQRLSVVLPAGATNTQQILAKYGIKVSVPITTVADLLSSSGPIRVTDAIINSVFGGKAAFDTLVKMVEAQTGKSLGGASPMYWYDLLKVA